MRGLRFAAGMLVALLALTQPVTAQVIDRGAVSANSSGSGCTAVRLACASFTLPTGTASVTLQVSGSFSGTLTFEATADGTNWVSAEMVNVASGSTATTTTTAGAFSVANLGLIGVRARATAWASGEATVVGTRGWAGGGGAGGGGASGEISISQTDDENAVDVLTIAAGDNNIGNVDLASAIPAGTNNIGDVDLASAIPAGTNNIGDVDVPGVGETTDAAATAGSTGSVNSKLRLLTTDVDRVADAVESANAQDVAHDAVDSGNPVKIGGKAAAFGTNPTAVAGADRSNAYFTLAGQQFVFNGHPNIITREWTVLDADGAQTGTALVDIAAGTRVVVLFSQVTCDADNTADVDLRMAFDTDATFAAAATTGTSGIIHSQPGIPAGGGSTVDIPSIGGDGEDVRYSLEDPAGGACRGVVKYFTVAQ